MISKSSKSQKAAKLNSNKCVCHETDCHEIYRTFLSKIDNIEMKLQDLKKDITILMENTKRF